MSSKTRTALSRRALVCASLALLTGVAGCQVQPLYGEKTHTRQMMASIAFSPAGDRVGQAVRNRLIFLAAGGQGEPAHPAYNVDLNVSSQTTEVLRDSYGDTNTAQRIVVSANYILRKAPEGTVLKIGHREAVALADIPTQQFAKLRAIRDAQDRAADELAELITADLAAVLNRGK
ncbi:LPS assembly lipoprotein LptE [Allorhizobium sp. BGMRC 0089]|uniref:LPS assembly lipoprotein LptE n=1 Tax=Allorhizobium sonneratiae TaxID=2934936 RepID=UPI0020345C9D|nr:LPS assembly lipoprotein LptE [Allorhizobium sonneratiae]MCM2294390.1 LPS assembly lipoprotein LptE [Allorhizobium sonneratiae]